MKRATLQTKKWQPMQRGAICAAAILLLAVPALQSQSSSPRIKGSPPIAISIASDDRALVLQADGALVDLDVRNGRRGQLVFQVQYPYSAVDAAAASASSGTRGC